MTQPAGSGSGDGTRRRALLLGGAALLAGRAAAAEETAPGDVPEAATPAPETPEPDPLTLTLPPGERFIWIRNGAGEEVATAYRAGQDYDGVALGRLQRLMRDLHEGVQGPLPPLLIDMLSVLQEQWNYTRPLLLRSGFRTPRTNALAEGAAPASLHLRGLAADITVPGMEPYALGVSAWRLSQRFGFMGVGFYTRFVHVDIGGRRAWTRFG